jgi:predicted NAD/FAD-binding protein
MAMRPWPAEGRRWRERRSALGAFRYQKEPRRPSPRPKPDAAAAALLGKLGLQLATGNFLHPKITVTYWMNLLQGIDQRYPLFVSLNPKRDIPRRDDLRFAPSSTIRYSTRGDRAQAQHRRAAGRRDTWFAGAHLGHGFHEDGLASAVRVARALGARIPWGRDALAAPQQKSRHPL